MIRMILLATLVVIAAAFDLKTRRIPNWLCAAGFIGGFLTDGPRDAMLGAGLALAIYVPLFALRAVGGGDVKLMAAVGSIAGPKWWIAIFLVTAIAGGFIALVLIIFKGRWKRTFRNVGVLLSELAHLRAPHRAERELDVTSERGLRLPHGCTIAVGTLSYLAYLVTGGSAGR